MSKKPSLIAGLELGTRQFTVAVGDFSESRPLGRGEHQRLLIREVASTPTRGLQRGVLSDPLECTDTVARVIRQAERSLGVRIPSVLVALPGNQVRSTNASASIPISDPGIGISPRDVERAFATCRNLSLDYDRQILHAFRRGFTVDGQAGIKDPVGLCGTKLAIELHLVTAQSLGLQNFTRVLNRAGLEVEEFVLPGLAAAEAVLSDLDRDLGVTLILVDELQTQIILFTDGQVRETFLIPWGAELLTENLSRTFKVPRAAADQLLEQVSSLEENPSLPDSPPLRVKVGSVIRTFPQGQVVHLIGAKTKEALNRIQHRLDQSPYFRESAAGVVMVGNLTRLEGFLEMAEGILNMPVRLGTAREVELNVPSLSTLGAHHTTVVGLLQHGARRRSLSPHSLSATGWLRWVERTRQLLEEYF